VRHYALSAIGVDRPGIVAAVAELLLRHGANVEDSRMAILRGHFTMMLIVSAAEGLDADSLRADLEQLRGRLGLEAVSLGEVPDLAASGLAEPSHVVSVYGADHPGIVHAIAGALAARRVNITDLQTRLLGEAGAQPLYVMLIEVALPERMAVEELSAGLLAVAREQGVEVSIRALEQAVL